MADDPQIETRDVTPRLVWLLIIGFAAFIAVSTIGLRLFFDPDTAWTFSRAAKPEPRLQIVPTADYDAFVHEKRAALTGYGWRDRAAGLATIPIEEAMRLVVEGHRAEVDPSALPQPGSCVGAGCPGAIPSAKTIPSPKTAP